MTSAPRDSKAHVNSCRKLGCGEFARSKFGCSYCGVVHYVAENSVTADIIVANSATAALVVAK